MHKKNPVIEIPTRPTDVILDLMGAGCILFMFVYGAMHYGSLPDTIPTKFGVDGNPTQWSPKPILWLLPVIGLITWKGMYILNKYPHIFNYPVKITPENAYYQYLAATRLIRYLNTGIALMWVYFFVSMIQMAMGEVNSMSKWMLPITLTVTIGPVIVYLFYATKKSKKPVNP